MFQWLAKWKEQWSGWISDSDLERSLRAHLCGRGYYGDSAKFLAFRLVAIQRPGWLQVFSYCVEARVATGEHSAVPPAEREVVKLFGLVRQDERYRRCDIEIFRNASERYALYNRWTEDLIRLRSPNL